MIEKNTKVDQTKVFSCQIKIFIFIVLGTVKRYIEYIPTWDTLSGWRRLTRIIDHLIHRVDIVCKNIGFSQWQKCGCLDHSCQIPWFHMLSWSKSSLPLFLSVKFLRAASSISPGSKAATTSGLSRFLLWHSFWIEYFHPFPLLEQKTVGDHINGGHGSLSPGFSVAATWKLHPGIAIFSRFRHHAFPMSSKLSRSCLNSTQESLGVSGYTTSLAIFSCTGNFRFIIFAFRLTLSLYLTSIIHLYSILSTSFKIIVDPVPFL